jgi:hypothetical protein
MNEVKKRALAKHLGSPYAEIKQINKLVYQCGETHYYVLSDREANSKAYDSIMESMWAFKPSFILSQANLPENSLEIIEGITGWAEHANEIISRLIENKDKFVRDAIRSDGRGQFIAQYDGKEEAIQYDKKWLFIYKIG